MSPSEVGNRLLTDTQAGDQLSPCFRDRAEGKDGLQEVGSENIGDNILRGRPDDEKLDPEFRNAGREP